MIGSPDEDADNARVDWLPEVGEPSWRDRGTESETDRVASADWGDAPQPDEPTVPLTVHDFAPEDPELDRWAFDPLESSPERQSAEPVLDALTPRCLVTAFGTARPRSALEGEIVELVEVQPRTLAHLAARLGRPLGLVITQVQELEQRAEVHVIRPQISRADRHGETLDPSPRWELEGALHGLREL